MPLINKIRFQKIDDSNIGDHSKLRPEDTCLYLYEYTSGQGYTASSTNQLISNLKKKPSERLTKGGWPYKAQAITQCASALRQVTNPKWLAEATLVPTPGSKIVGHPDYDDRMIQICRAITAGADVRSLVYQTESTERAHEAGPLGQRITVEELLAIYRIDEDLAEPAPKQIGIFDDVLTAGTHYRAMHTILSQRFPGTPITGIFIARRIFPSSPHGF